MIDWKRASEKLKSLQAELYGALKAGADWVDIQRIENNILMSFSARAMAVKRVVTNKGGKTRGVDNVVWTRDEQKMVAVEALKTQKWKLYEAKPVRRVWIPKPDRVTLRPLGIPTMMDRAMKRLAKLDTRLSKLKVQLLIQQDGVCPRCGEVINLDVEAVERDHIIPKAEGGEDTKKNTVLLHKTCHQQKTAWERKWRAYYRKLEKQSIEINETCPDKRQTEEEKTGSNQKN